MTSVAKLFAVVLYATVGLSMSGCSMLIGKYTNDFGKQISEAILDHDDPETVSAALPSYLILLDSRAKKQGAGMEINRASARLYTAYASLFVKDKQRRKVLTRRALHYSRMAVCQYDQQYCDLDKVEFKVFQQTISQIDHKDAEALYGLGLSWVTWISANKEDWNAVMQLAQVKLLMNRIIEVDEAIDDGGAHYVLGILNTLVPPAMGGKPQVAKQHFEQAIKISHQRNLSYKVAYAERYARLVFDQQLHDKLLNEVIEYHGDTAGYTLINTMAKRRAKELLASSNEYF